MANHKTYGAVVDPASTGKPLWVVFYNTSTSSWPARPAGGSAICVQFIGPDTAPAPGDMLDWDLRTKVTMP